MHRYSQILTSGDEQLAMGTSRDRAPLELDARRSAVQGSETVQGVKPLDRQPLHDAYQVFVALFDQEKLPPSFRYHDHPPDSLTHTRGYEDQSLVDQVLSCS